MPAKPAPVYKFEYGLKRDAGPARSFWRGRASERLFVI